MTTSGDTGTSATGTASAAVPPERTYPPEEPRIAASTWWIAFGVLLVVVVIVVVSIGALRHWVALHTGIIHGGPDQYYNFWSGFGSDLGEVTLISAVGVGVVHRGPQGAHCHTKAVLADRSHHRRSKGALRGRRRHHHPATCPRAEPPHAAHRSSRYRRHRRGRGRRGRQPVRGPRMGTTGVGPTTRYAAGCDERYVARDGGEHDAAGR